MLQLVGHIVCAELMKDKQTHPNDKEMNCHFVIFSLISIIFLFNVQLGLCTGKGSTPSQRQRLALPRVSCSQRGIKAVFGSQVKSNIRVRDKTGATLAVPQSDSLCGVKMGTQNNRSLFFLGAYDSCYAQIKDNKVVIPLQVQLAGELGWFRVNISCSLTVRPKERTALSSTKFHGSCAIQKDFRVKCGRGKMSSDSCFDQGCCYNTTDSECYYRLNSCSLDGHFVFAVKTTETKPRTLAVKDQPRCLPLITTADTAVFKIPVTDCGVKTKVNGRVVIYELEVEELPDPIRANHSSFRLQIECEYEASAARRAVNLRSMRAVTNPPPVVALGTIRVQMRIATDSSFTCYFPEDQLPLTLPLRETVYVEIAIAQPSPDPALSLHVRDCFAYPASRHSVWMLLHDGCPNHLDDSGSSIPVDSQGKTYSHSQVRRFDVKTFAFVKKGQPSVEEIYFYCWVEICTEDVDCEQRCAIISSDGERQKRGASSNTHPTQLVSLGPFILRQNNTKMEDDPCVQQNLMYKATIFTVAGIGTMTTLLLLVMVVLCLSNRKCHKQKATQTSDVQVEDAI
ncbi:zona pellucida sperm-binding protein 4-like [Syngnathoides biaculeatus]|uniref:zona pellucida sperm-binding protein 4-like n=1 Tax=Syngnathoides biaculeatus TaxID=300417 RepID=UPI002ADD5F99|nr:zona pellucida sperm-binding protein 4-like [Syngnathoides biaculeatus]